jgi:hypothetical protein
VVLQLLNFSHRQCEPCGPAGTGIEEVKTAHRCPWQKHLGFPLDLPPIESEIVDAVLPSEKFIRGEAVESCKLRYFNSFEFFDHTGKFSPNVTLLHWAENRWTEFLRTTSLKPLVRLLFIIQSGRLNGPFKRPRSLQP